MNRLAQFLHYAQKVFRLSTLLRGVRDERPWARIQTYPVILTLVFGVVLRISVIWICPSKPTAGAGGICAG